MTEQGIPVIYLDRDEHGCYKIPAVEVADDQGLAVTIDRQFKLEPVEEVDPDYAKKQRQRLDTLMNKQNATTEDFYNAQSYQQIGRKEKRVHVPIWIDPALDREWKKWLNYGIEEINKAAPGLKIDTVHSKCASKIDIEVHCEPLRADTRGSILDNVLTGKARIRLGRDWPNSSKKRTATHEMLHALGYEHEHQREDAGSAIEPGNSTTAQVEPLTQYIGISRFDPYSIMLYPECTEYFERKDGEDGDSVWKEKKGKKVNVEMSELDKVGLNLLYRPCYGPDYNPVISPRTGMMYCGRSVMSRHNVPHCQKTKTCGPETGPNCPACRTLNTSRVKEVTGYQDSEVDSPQGQETSDIGGAIKKVGKQRWQGWSGLVYCGCTFEQRRKLWRIPLGTRTRQCGPDSGEPCEECKRFLAI